MMATKPIFRIRKIPGFQLSSTMTHMLVNNEWMFVMLRNNNIVIIDMNDPDNMRELSIEKVAPDDLVHNVFLDPTGRHFIISMQSENNYYLTRQSARVRTLHKTKGHLIESVGWNRINATDTSTGNILIGTSRGMIFETVLEDVKQKIKAQSAQTLWKEVYSHDKPISGIEWGRMDRATDYFVMVAMPDRMQQYIGSIPRDSEFPIFQHIFAPYENRPSGDDYMFRSESLGYSYLRLFHAPGQSKPSAVAWMSGHGVFHANLDLSTRRPKNIATRNKCIPFPYDNPKGVTQSVASAVASTIGLSMRIGAPSKEPASVGVAPQGGPLGMEVTEFHVLLLYRNTVTALCHLNSEPVAVDTGNPEIFGQFKSMCRDSIGGRVWGFSDKTVFRVDINNESRNVKEIFMDLGQFDSALKFSSPEEERTVKMREAEYYYERGEHERAAELFAATDLGFQQTALKFIDLPSEEPLKRFLWCRLMKLASGVLCSDKNETEDAETRQDRSQMLMLSLWILEIYLNQLGKLRDAGQTSSPEHDGLQIQFYEFLSTQLVKETLATKKESAYKLIESHGNVEDMVQFAALMTDYEKLVKYQIRNGLYARALKTIVEQPNINLHYTFGGLLLKNIPEETLAAWKRLGSRLYPPFLLPCLIQADPRHAVCYLEFAVNEMHSRDMGLHNLLVSLYAKFFPERLQGYLDKHGQDNNQVPYDAQHALRLCRDNGRDVASIHLCRMLNLWEEAVDLALQTSPNLAKEIASSLTIDDDLKKKLWLRIARHVVDEEKDIQRAMALVDECSLLKIEDILPFFPDFETIDHFKEAICKSLDSYNTHIEELKAEMETATHNAEVIHDEMRNFRSRYQVITSEETCSRCKLPLLWRTFYLFPCQHSFHTDCLESTVKPHLSPEQRKRFLSLRSRVQNGGASTPGAGGAGTVHQFRGEYEELIASDCPLCGQQAIDSVDRPLITPATYAQEMSEWDI